MGGEGAGSRIIVRMPNWIGDVVMATPVLADLRRAYPKAEITAMCRAPVCELLKQNPNIDELFCFQRPSLFSRRQEERNIIEKLRKGNYDMGVLLTHSFSSAWWFWLGGVKQRIGYRAHMRSWLLNHALPFPENLGKQHLVITYKQLLQPLHIPISDTPPQLYVTDQEIREANALLREYRVPQQALLVGINPGATYGSAKCWLPERFKDVSAKLLSDNNVYLLYFGDPATASLINAICKNFPARVINLAGKTSIRELAALISCCRLVLTNDSGPMHIADALKIPTIALFGSTSDVVTGPYRMGKVIHKRVGCSPCYERECPIDFRCMRQITAEEVFEAVSNELYSSPIQIGKIPRSVER